MTTDTIFSTLDRLATRFGPLNTLLDRVVDRVVPHKTVKACNGSQPICYSYCDNHSYCGGWCQAGILYKIRNQIVVYKVAAGGPCISANMSACTITCGCIRQEGTCPGG